MVIRPIPARLHPQVNVTTVQPLNTTNNNETDEAELHEGSDDEMFLDADGELSSEVAIDTGLPIKRKQDEKEQVPVTTTQGNKHIIFKRKNQEEETMSDYGNNLVYVKMFISSSLAFDKK